MFLELVNASDSKNYGRLNKLARESCTYNALYEFWLEQLFERIMRIFVWEGTGEVPPKEIESRLLLKGHCGITKFKGELTAMWGGFYGVTKYADQWTNYTARCPIGTVKRTIGKDIVVADNTSIRNAAYPLVHHYAMMLAHNEVTMIDALVNLRDSNGIPVVQTEIQKQSVAEYQARKFNGQYGSVTDPAMLGIDFVMTTDGNASSIASIWETREKILKAFYSDIGVKSSFEKRSNTVVNEVEADNSLLLLNISDMLACRERCCEEVNAMFGTNWSVHVADEIDYEKEEVNEDADNDRPLPESEE